MPCRLGIFCTRVFGRVLVNLGIKERGFEYANVGGFGDKTSISASDFGSIIVIEANGRTIQLPTMSSLPAGKLITIYCYGGNGSPIVLQTQPGNYFSNGPGGNRSTSITLSSQETLTIVSEGGSSPNWEIYGNGALKYSPLFGSSLFANGYQRLPSGLIIQWGYINVPPDDRDCVTNFPIPFVNQCLRVLATQDYISGSAAAGYIAANSGDLPPTSFTSRSHQPGLGGSYIAIGF